MFFTPIVLLHLLGCASTDTAVKATDTSPDTGVDPDAPPCAGESWGEISDPDNAVFVDAAGGDDATADGSRGAPYATVAAALAAAPVGGRIALLPGTYVEEPLDVASGVGEVAAIEGCGSHEVVIEASRSVTSLITVNALVLHLAGVTLRGGAWTLRVWNGADVSVTDVVVDGSQYTGVYVTGESTVFSMMSSSVTGVVAPEEYPGVGYGIVVEDGTATLADVAVVGAVGTGVLAKGAQDVRFDGVDVSDVLSTPDGTLGRGFQFEGVASGLMIDCNITSVSDAGVYALTTADLSMSRVSITGVAPALVGGASSGDALVFTGDDGESRYDPTSFQLSAESNVFDAQAGADGATRSEVIVESATALLSPTNTTAADVPLDPTRVYAQEGATITGIAPTQLEDGEELALSRTALQFEFTTLGE